MKKYKSIVLVAICIILLISLVGCTTPDGSSSSSSSSSSGSVSVAIDTPEQDMTNMVDERFELLSLVFRLAGREEYNDVYTEYQMSLGSEFDEYKEHEAVKYTSKLPLGYDAVFNFSVHIKKDGEQFAFIDDISSLVADGRWTNQSATEFIKLLNDFYIESKFSEFYQSNSSFYEAQTEEFVNSIYSEIDLKWFDTYVNSDNLRSIYSPSSSRNNYSATVNDTIVYCAVSGEGSVIVHEYCHSFANAIAHKWYEENEEFKKWCKETIDPVKLPSYGSGEIIAGEYLTRAYNSLYYAEHGYSLPILLFAEKAQGFPYIEEVYAMITPYEKPEMGEDKIKSILGTSYEMGEEQSTSIGERKITWKFLALSEPVSFRVNPTEVGNVFGSKTNDVLYVEDTGESTPYLLIDLGETSFQGVEGFRSYLRIVLE